MDAPIKNVKGMEQILRRRDLPSFCHVTDLTRLDFQILTDVTQQTRRARGLILNTFTDLDGPILSQIQTQCPNLYTIGPVHSLLKTRIPPSDSSNSSTSLNKEDRSCINWLDQQPSKSVIYVSFGSIATLTKDQLIEFWYGLVNSNVRFLWVIRPDSIAGKDKENKPPVELEEGIKKRGYIVEWAPQEEVLRHPAVGGFLTHSGWNSTLETIVEGLPMICWPFFSDQLISSRFVEKVWRLGFDMKGSCDRVVIEKMVRELMNEKKEEFAERAKEMSKMAKDAVKEGGSSFCSLERLLEDIRQMTPPTFMS